MGYLRFFIHHHRKQKKRKNISSEPFGKQMCFGDECRQLRPHHRPRLEPWRVEVALLVEGAPRHD